MKPKHTLIAYFDDGAVLRRPWRVRGPKRNGPATDEALALWADHDFYTDELCHPPRTHRVERAVLTRDVQLQGRSWGKTPVVMAHYLRSTRPTAQQERLIERIIAKAYITFANCKPQDNGNIVIETWHHEKRRADTIVYRHPTEKELIYDWH